MGLQIEKLEQFGPTYFFLYTNIVQDFQPLESKLSYGRIKILLKDGEKKRPPWSIFSFLHAPIYSKTIGS